MEPINYMLPNIAGTGNVLQGYAAGLNFRGAEQQMAMNAAQEARAQQLHPIAMEGAQLGMDAQRQNMALAQAAEGRNAAMFPYAIAEQEAAITQRQAQAAAAARQAEFQGALASLGPTATVADYQAVITQYPELSEGLADAVKDMSEQQRRGNAQILGQASVALRAGNADRAIQLVSQYASALEGAGMGQEAQLARGLIDTMRVDPDAAAAGMGLMLTHLDPEIAERAFGGGEAPEADRIRSTSPIGVRGAVVFNMEGPNGPYTIVQSASGQRYEGAEADGFIQGEIDYEVSRAQELNTARSRGTQQGRLGVAGEVTFEETLGRARGQQAAEDIASAPGEIERANTGIGTIDRLLGNPAFDSIFGSVQGRMAPGIPLATGGQQGADAAVDLQQLQGQAFLQAYQSLRGGGQITEVEGVKAEAAIARLNRTQSPQAARAALMELRNILQAGIARAEGRMVPSLYADEEGVTPQQDGAPSYWEFE